MQITRIGVYGILIDSSKILLTRKLKGPFKDLLDLPGGGIEFGESPEEALSRELKEEVAMKFSEMDLFSNLSHCGTYKDGDKTYRFHHIGLIYSIKKFSKIPNREAEDPFDWCSLKDLSLSLLTPFAAKIVDNLQNQKVAFT